MHVYFVRHGVTELNKKHLHQAPSTPLVEEGRVQARTRGEALRVCNPDMLLTSPYARAMETARIVSYHIGVEPISDERFREVERPASLYGVSHHSFKTFWYAFLMLIHKNNKNWRYESSENFSDIAERAKEALVCIESLRDTHSSVVIISHAAFINIMVSYMCRDTLLGFWDSLLTFLQIKKMKNTGVITVEYIGGGNEHACNWRVVSK